MQRTFTSHPSNVSRPAHKIDHPPASSHTKIYPRSLLMTRRLVSLVESCLKELGTRYQCHGNSLSQPSAGFASENMEILKAGPGVALSCLSDHLYMNRSPPAHLHVLGRCSRVSRSLLGSYALLRAHEICWQIYQKKRPLCGLLFASIVSPHCCLSPGPFQNHCLPFTHLFHHRCLCCNTAL
jgi:hypothetical protein